MCLTSARSLERQVALNTLYSTEEFFALGHPHLGPCHCLKSPTNCPIIGLVEVVTSGHQGRSMQHAVLTRGSYAAKQDFNKKP